MRYYSKNIICPLLPVLSSILNVYDIVVQVANFLYWAFLAFCLMASLYPHVWSRHLAKEWRGSDICRELKIVPLFLFCVERIQLLRLLTKMPPGCLPLEVFGLGRDPPLTQGAPEGLYGSRLAWESHGDLQEELESVAGRRDVWNSPLSMLSPWPHPG